jgi:hypothetical protein
MVLLRALTRVIGMLLTVRWPWCAWGSRCIAWTG